ncbi:MAG: hypothetical protein EA356_03560, partial [Geminicoccaceae bacterium]
MGDWDHVTVTDGVDQAGRLPPALADGYVRVDERDVASRIAGLVDLAGHLPFVDLGNRPHGTWQDLWLAEDAAVMALILAERRNLREGAFTRLMERDASAALLAVVDLAFTIESWHLRLRQARTRPGRELCRRIEELIASRLAPELQALVAFAAQCRVPLPGARDPGHWSAAWQGKGVGTAAAKNEAAPPRQRLRRGFDAMLNGIAYLQWVCRDGFLECARRDDHEPATALLLTTLDLFDAVAAKLDQFTARHNAFYYQDVLGTRRRAAEPARVLLSFPDAAGQVATPVPVDTEIEAVWPDAPDGARFRTDALAFVSAARLAAAHTLHYQRDPLMSPQHEMGFVTRIRHTRLPLGAAGTLERRGWALLGGDPADVFAGTHAAVGLAFTSPALLLREGERRLTLRLALASPATLPVTTRAAWQADIGDDVLPRGPLEGQFRARLESDPGLLAGIAVGSLDETVQFMLDALRPGEGRIGEIDAQLLPDDPLQALFLRIAMRVARPGRERGFSVPFGRLMARLMLGPDRAVPDAIVDEIVDEAERVLGPRPKGEAAAEHPVRKLLTETRAYQYEKYLKDAFTLELSTAEGWLAVPELGVLPLANAGDPRPGLVIALYLGRDAPAIVPHAALAEAMGLPATAPLARLRLAADATLCAQTLLEPFLLEEIGVDVEVRGVRNVVVANDQGPLDPAQAFQPFGPQPRLDGGFVVGAFEAAKKRLSALTLRLEWSGLPLAPGGFETHYAAYGANEPMAFTAKVDWLDEGVWRSLPRATSPLFAPVTAAERLPSAMAIQIDLPPSSTPLPAAAPEAAFVYGVAARTGFVRLRL